MLGQGPASGGQAVADGGDGERTAVQHAEGGVAQAVDALGMHIRAEHAAENLTHLGQQSFLFHFLPASDQRVSGSRWRICAGYPRDCGATSHSWIEFMQLNYSHFRDSSARLAVPNRGPACSSASSLPGRAATCNWWRTPATGRPRASVCSLPSAALTMPPPTRSSTPCWSPARASPTPPC